MNKFKEFKNDFNEIISKFEEYQTTFDDTMNKLRIVGNNMHQSSFVPLSLAKALETYLEEFEKAILDSCKMEISTLLNPSSENPLNVRVPIYEIGKPQIAEEIEDVSVFLTPIIDHRETLKLFKKPRTKVNKEKK
jgi:hypothetical protein